jgi:tRNA (guanine-N7-)-methyltransferase
MNRSAASVALGRLKSRGPEADVAARDVPGALYGSRLITLPHVVGEVEAFREFVGGRQPVLVDVGFDHGRRLHSTARHNAGWRLVGLETRKRRVEEARARAARDELENLLVWRMDARTVFAGAVVESTVDIVEILFPTPWWNPAHRRKRLLIDDAFLVDVARALLPGGLIHLATDVPRYAAHVQECIARIGAFEAVSSATFEEARPECRQQSRREWKCEREGIPVARAYYRRTIEVPRMCHARAQGDP